MGGLSLVSLASHAETVKGLYQVREPVSSQAPEERDQATQRALDTLVLRLTGDPKAAQSPGLAALRKDPQQIISQYGFDAGPPEVLKVDFDPASHRAGVAPGRIVSVGRESAVDPGLVVERSTEGSSLVGDGQASAAPLRRAAQHRGLPLRLPLADLNEQLVATAPNLEGADATPLRGASDRTMPMPCSRCMPVKRVAVAGQVESVAGRQERGGQRTGGGSGRSGRCSDAGGQ